MKPPLSLLGGFLALAALSGAFIFASGASAASASTLSYTWAGFVAPVPHVTAVEGSWVVPSASSTAALSGDAEWIGIGGYTGGDLIQVGTRARFVDGTVSYLAWYELLPAAAVPLPMQVHPGDLMRASIAKGAGNEWEITLEDATTGTRYATSVPYESSGSSAEWVLEAPRTPAGSIALDQFSPIAFSAISYAVNGTEVPLTAGAFARLNLVSRERASLADASALSAGAFAITRD